jgi:hypothetical protein
VIQGSSFLNEAIASSQDFQAKALARTEQITAPDRAGVPYVPQVEMRQKYQGVNRRWWK